MALTTTLRALCIAVPGATIWLTLSRHSRHTVPVNISTRRAPTCGSASHASIVTQSSDPTAQPNLCSLRTQGEGAGCCTSRGVPCRVRGESDWDWPCALDACTMVGSVESDTDLGSCSGRYRLSDCVDCSVSTRLWWCFHFKVHM